MKKILLILLTLSFLFYYNTALGANSCDEVFNYTLRHGHNYSFGDHVSNPSGSRVWLESYNVSFIEQGNFNRGSDPTFSWTNWIKGKSYILNGGDSGQALESNSTYSIIDLPTSRRFGNLEIIYDINYKVEGTQDIIRHRECANYEITWCGDGVLDTQYETCDPNDSSKRGWGTGGCDFSCKPVVDNKPSCTNITVSPSFGTAPYSGTITCNGNNNPSGYKITSNGIEIYSGAGNSFSVSNIPAGNYSLSCFVLDNTGKEYGSYQCNKTINVTEQSCKNGSTTGVQQSPIDSNTPGLCQTGYAVGNFVPVVNGNTTNYTWSCGGVSGGSCKASYTSTVNPICENGGTTGVQQSPVTIITPGLCKDGFNVGNFEASVSGYITNYTWSCGGISGGSCNASYRSNNGGNPCITGGVHGEQTNPIAETTPNLCRSGETVSGFTIISSGNTDNYTWLCNGNSGGSCSASYTTGSSSSSSSSGGTGGPERCGDGIVQRPSIEEFSCVTGVDDLGFDINGICEKVIYEECDFGNSPDWGFCSRECKYIDVTFPGHCQGGRSCEITIPNGGSIIFGPNDNVIIGSGMNPYTAHSLQRPFIKNLSDYDLYFDKLCVIDKEGTTLLGSNKCEDLGIIKSGRTKYFPYVPNFVGATITNGDYGDNKLVTTIQHGGNPPLEDAYFISELDVRVAKSSVATVGGGTSYISDDTGISNISDVSDNGELDPDKNKNFVGVGIGGGDDSSYSKNITDSESVEIIDEEGEEYSDSLDQVSDNVGTALGDTSILSEFESYNGIKNVFILKNKNFVVESNTFDGLSGARTYIVENGNLKINANINYRDNIAFVIKSGNVLVYKDVTNINGTYISIVNDGNGGEFKGTGGSTVNVLTVNGSLYGKINDLISKRTYVKQNSNSQLDVGTIVSFGSSLFRKPAPLIGTFISEYLQADKVAQ